MLKKRGRLPGSYLIAVAAILTAGLITSAHAQYSGECWVADYNNVFKISSNGKTMKISGFFQPLSLSINPVDGSCWVADTDALSVRKLSADGKELAKLNGSSQPPVFTSNPSSVSVDSRDGSCWVGVFDSIYKFSSDAKQLLKIEGFDEPVVAVNSKNGECWVADSNNARVVRLSADGKQLGTMQVEGISQPKSLSVNPADNTCWVLDPFTQKVARLSPDGKVLAQASVAPPDGSAIMATCVVATPESGCWVGLMIDATANDQVLKLSADGKQLLSVGGFGMPSSLAFDPKDNGCWVTDSNNGLVVKLSANGQKVMNIQGFNQPKPVAVGYLVK